MSLTKELFQRLMEEFENQGATESQIMRLINSPEKILGVLSHIDDEADIVPRQEILEKSRPIIYLDPVTSYGLTGIQHVELLRRKGCRVGHLTKSVMAKPAFVPTREVVYRPVVVPGSRFSDEDRTSLNVNRVATSIMRLVIPPLELAPILRSHISNEKMVGMGFQWLPIMHELVTDSSGDECRLGLAQNGEDPGLNPYPGGDSRVWLKQTGFVYLAPQEQ